MAEDDRGKTIELKALKLDELETKTLSLVDPLTDNVLDLEIVEGITYDTWEEVLGVARGMGYVPRTSTRIPRRGGCGILLYEFYPSLGAYYTYAKYRIIDVEEVGERELRYAIEKIPEDELGN